MSDSILPSRAAIEADQWIRLRLLLDELKSNPFYSRRLAEAGEIRGHADFCVKFPLTTKAQCSEDQSVHPPFGTNLTYPLDRYTRFHSTSGTTASPLRWLDTPESWQWMLDNWKRVYAAAEVTRGDRVFFAFSFGPFLGFWTAFEAAAQIGLLCIPGGGLGSAARARLILDSGATVLCCTPTYAIRLAQVALEEQLDLSRSRVRHIIVAGEPGGSVPAVRNQIESLWPGAAVHDHHGMTEVGPVSYECPRRRCTLRVIESSYVAEVIDPQSALPVGEGETGELVLTTLGRTGSPLLRYRTGDLVKPIYLNESGDGPGPHLSLDSGILGRADDMLLVRGVNVFPSAVDDVVRREPRVAEYRVRVDTTHSMTELSVEVEPVSGSENDPTLAPALESSLRAAFSLRIPVTVVQCGSLPRFEMKAQRWMKTQ